jgi:hypothetical protein
LANKPENATKVIGKDCTSEPKAIDKTSSLEDVLFLIGDLLCTLRIVQGNAFRGVVVGVTLVDLE